MGLNNEGARRMIFDIETAPLPECADYLEPVDAPGNYKDAAKIDAYKAEKRQEQIEKAGLDLDLCQIVAIAWWQEDLTPIVLTRQQADEALMLETFWHLAQASHLVGFNCIGFDLPVLQRRSLYLGVPMPTIQVDKYRHPHVTDLLQILSYNGALKFRGLGFYCKRFGIPYDESFGGADVAKAVEAGQWEAISSHARNDVTATALLGNKLGVFQPTTQAALAL